jgi:hypothetical protein
MEFDLLKKSSVIGVYTFKSTEPSVLFVAAFKDKFLWAVGHDRTLFVPKKFEEHQEFLIEYCQYVSKEYKIKTFLLNKLEDPSAFLDDKKLFPVDKKPAGISPVPLKNIEHLLIEEGFDTSELSKTLDLEIKERDYSNLLKVSADARLVFDFIKAKIKGKTIEEKYMSIAESIKKGLFNFIYLVGPAGTGKTSLTYFLSQFCGAPLFTYQGSEGVEKDEIIGASDVNTDEDAKSQFKVILGQLLKAYIEGYQIVIDEANFILPGVLAVVNSLTDDTPTVTFKGVTYQRHPNFVLYLTSNPGYEGTYLYNPATKTRGITILVPQLDQKEFTRRLMSMHDRTNKSFSNSLFNFFSKIQKLADQWGENASLCIRQADHFCRLIFNKAHTYEQFDNSFQVSVLNNVLAMDNDNCTKLDSFLKSPEYKKDLDALYSLYDTSHTRGLTDDPQFVDELEKTFGEDDE